MHIKQTCFANNVGDFFSGGGGGGGEGMGRDVLM